MEEKYQKISEKLGQERIKRNEPLASYTAFKIGGAADLFYEANSQSDLLRVIKITRENGVAYFILAGGSNVLVSDKGFRGMIIKVQSSKFKVHPAFGGTKFKIISDSGVLLRTLVNESVKNSLSGLEFAAGIPGTVGGAVRGNAGAWQKSIGEIVNRVKVFTEDGEIKWRKKEECEFEYRKSRFMKTRDIILEVELEMEKKDKKEIEKQVKENLEKRTSQPKEPSAGCIFVNPKPQSAGSLIEQCGLKGQKVGQAQISPKHANFIINLGGAKARDVLALIDLIKENVREKFNIDLKEEIVKIGEF